MDIFADNLVKKCIGEIIVHKDKLLDDKQVWFNFTKCMFRNFRAIEVYGMIEQALAEISDEQWLEHKYPKGLSIKKKKSVIKINLKNAATRKAINDNLKITDVAEEYGIIVKNEKALCPFHNDKEASLSFSNEKNVFNCFGCGAKGDIITFIKKMEEKKKEDDKSDNS